MSRNTLAALAKNMSLSALEAGIIATGNIVGAEAGDTGLSVLGCGVGAVTITGAGKCTTGVNSGNGLATTTPISQGLPFSSNPVNKPLAGAATEGGLKITGLSN